MNTKNSFILKSYIVLYFNILFLHIKKNEDWKPSENILIMYYQMKSAYL